MKSYSNMRRKALLSQEGRLFVKFWYRIKFYNSDLIKTGIREANAVSNNVARDFNIMISRALKEIDFQIRAEYGLSLSYDEINQDIIEYKVLDYFIDYKYTPIRNKEYSYKTKNIKRKGINKRYVITYRNGKVISKEHFKYKRVNTINKEQAFYQEQKPKYKGKKQIPITFERYETGGKQKRKFKSLKELMSKK